MLPAADAVPALPCPALSTPPPLRLPGRLEAGHQHQRAGERLSAPGQGLAGTPGEGRSPRLLPSLTWGLGSQERRAKETTKGKGTGWGHGAWECPTAWSLRPNPPAPSLRGPGPPPHTHPGGVTAPRSGADPPTTLTSSEPLLSPQRSLPGTQEGHSGPTHGPGRVGSTCGPPASAGGSGQGPLPSPSPSQQTQKPRLQTKKRRKLARRGGMARAAPRPPAGRACRAAGGPAPRRRSYLAGADLLLQLAVAVVPHEVVQRVLALGPLPG